MQMNLKDLYNSAQIGIDGFGTHLKGQKQQWKTLNDLNAVVDSGDAFT